MADERDLDLLDEYLSNRMSEPDRFAFEQRLQSDPDLRNEYDLQQRVIKGIKNARVAELKAMLNNVPIPAKGPGNSLATKFFLGTVVTLMIAAAAYWYVSREEMKITPPQSPAEEEVIRKEPVSPGEEPEAQAGQKQQPQQEQRSEQDKNQTSAGTEHSKPSLAKKPEPLKAPGETNQAPKKEPVLDGFDPAAEDSTPGADNINEDQPGATPGKSALMVETDVNNERYRFHYQFTEGKVVLYGPFEQHLYEIVELNAGGNRTVFLYYKEQYYGLAEADGKIRSLEPIKDPALLQQLKEHRSSN